MPADGSFNVKSGPRPDVSLPMTWLSAVGTVELIEAFAEAELPVYWVVIPATAADCGMIVRCVGPVGIGGGCLRLGARVAVNVSSLTGGTVGIIYAVEC